jgi:hypothetical protein
LSKRNIGGGMIYAIDNKKRLVRKITKEEIVYFFNNNYNKRNRFTYIADKINAKRYIKNAMEAK